MTMDLSISQKSKMRMERMNKKSPMRMCVGCHEMREKREMIRVLKMQDNTFCIDAAGRKNGRGAYLCKKMECLNQAVQNHGLERSFKMSIPKEIIAELTEEMKTIAE